MARHARGAAGSRLSAAPVLLGMLIVLVMAAGSWLSSRAQPAITKAIDASAVVVSSLACTGGASGTIVDVLGPAGPQAGGTVRATLDACGYQEGQQLAVQYPSGDPRRVALAGSDTAADGTMARRLLPVGLAAAGLLALGAVFVVWIDTRRSRRGRGRREPAHEILDADDGVVTSAEDSLDAPAAFLDPPDTAFPNVPQRGRHALPDEPDSSVIRAETATFGPIDDDHVPAAGRGRHGRLGAVQVLRASMVQDQAVAIWSRTDTGRDRRDPHRLSSVDMVFPSPTSLAASLHDELFTHRSVSG